MTDHLESLSPVSDPDSAPSLGEGDVGAKKAETAPLASAPQFESLAIAAAVLIQVLVLGGMILGRTVPYIGAKTVLLQVEPVDPRDLFRGDYVTLGYDISRTPGRNYQPGQPVFATLVPDADGRHYHAGEFLTEPPASGVFLRGKAEAYGRATYGIESYYVQEGTGHDYEKAVRTRHLWAEVAIDNQGNPALRRLAIE